MAMYDPRYMHMGVDPGYGSSYTYMQYQDPMTGRVYKYLPGDEYRVQEQMQRDRERYMYERGQYYAPSANSFDYDGENKKRLEAERKKAEEDKKLKDLIAHFYNEGKSRG